MASDESCTGDEYKEKEFDVWPSQEAKGKIEHARRLASKYMAIVQQRGNLPDKWWEYDSDESSALNFEASVHDESSGEESN